MRRWWPSGPPGRRSGGREAVPRKCDDHYAERHRAVLPGSTTITFGSFVKSKSASEFFNGEHQRRLVSGVLIGDGDVTLVQLFDDVSCPPRLIYTRMSTRPSATSSARSSACSGALVLRTRWRRRAAAVRFDGIRALARLRRHGSGFESASTGRTSSGGRLRLTNARFSETVLETSNLDREKGNATHCSSDHTSRYGEHRSLVRSRPRERRMQAGGRWMRAAARHPPTAKGLNTRSPGSRASLRNKRRGLDHTSSRSSCWDPVRFSLPT